MGQLQVWRSDLSQDDGLHGNPAESKMFVKQPPLAVGSDGVVTLPLLVDQIVTLTTLKAAGGHGVRSTANSSRAGEPLPLPFVQTFDDEEVDKPAKYWYTQMGAWEVHETVVAAVESAGGSSEYGAPPSVPHAVATC